MPACATAFSQVSQLSPLWLVRPAVVQQLRNRRRMAAYLEQHTLHSEALCSTDRRLWRASDGTLLQTISTNGDYTRHLAFTPDGRTLATSTDDNAIQLWRVADGALLWTTKLKFAPRGLAVAPDNHTLAVSTYDDVLLWRYR